MDVITDEIRDKIAQLAKKFAASGQDLNSYLEGLLHSDYLKYWDYIHLDALLSLQHPRTNFPDESIFITYHQITELYFKLILQAIDLIVADPSSAQMKKQLVRINRYMRQVTTSFDIMVDGMDKDEFLKFRMSLLPASGFQSAQYRMIELCATDAHLLASPSDRSEQLGKSSTRDVYEKLYWKQGGIELATNRKTLTLEQFEEKYEEAFIAMIEERKDCNLLQLFNRLPLAEQDDELRSLLREFDLWLEVNWPLSHYRSAVRYLEMDPVTIAATGGTNWQKYLPPRFQQVQLFPELWSSDEKAGWGTHTKSI